MKRVVILILFFLLIFPVISAVEFDMKYELAQGETLMARVSGNFADPILKEKIFLYRDHVRVSMNPNVAKIDDEFYIYSSLSDKVPGNYSVVIKDVIYMEGATITDKDIVKNFTILNETAAFSVNPGFVITNQEFEIQTQNLFNQKIEISISITEGDTGGIFSSLSGGEDTLELKSGEIEKIKFNVGDLTEPSLEKIILNSEGLKYEIPVYLYVNSTQEESKERSFKFESPEINISLSTNSNTTKVIYLKNTGETILKNISLTLSDQLKPYINLSIDYIYDLDENDSSKIELEIDSDSFEQDYSGQLVAKMENGSDVLYTYAAIFLNFIEGYEPIGNNETEINTTKTCAEMNGNICNSTQECDQELVNAKDDKCCLGTCVNKEKSSTGTIIAIIIFVVIGGFLFWFYKTKYKGTKTKKVDVTKVGEKTLPKLKEPEKSERSKIKRN